MSPPPEPSGVSPECVPHSRAPDAFLARLRHLGPGLVISAVVVGSGELIVTPKLGATAGFSLLWLIVLGCFLKVFVQIELGRVAVARGLTTLEALNLVPGPRWRVSWVVWIWALMYLALVCQVAGMVGGLASISRLAGIPLAEPVLAVGVAATTAFLLLLGRYRWVERVCLIMVAAFTATTLAAVLALQWTPYAITPSQILSGFTFQLPHSFTIAFAAFGVIGVGASELVYYPYWCLEKGYARYSGPRESSPAWFDRAQSWIQVMRLDAWLSFILYTSATVAFYLLGAAILHGQNLEVSNTGMIETLSLLYRQTLGEGSFHLFLAGAFAVLFSTVFAATASNARMFADALTVFGLKSYPTDAHRYRMVRLGCVLLPTLATLVYLSFGTPLSLVIVGAVAQGLMLPFLAGAALYLHHRHLDPALRPGTVGKCLLWLAALSMAAAGLYQVGDQILKLLP